MSRHLAFCDANRPQYRVIVLHSIDGSDRKSMPVSGLAIRFFKQVSPSSQNEPRFHVSPAAPKGVVAAQQVFQKPCSTVSLSQLTRWTNPCLVKLMERSSTKQASLSSGTRCLLLIFLGAGQPRRHGGLGGLSPPKQSSEPPQIEAWNTIHQWSFGQFLECQAPPPHTRSLPAEPQSPPYWKLSGDGSGAGINWYFRI